VARHPAAPRPAPSRSSGHLRHERRTTRRRSGRPCPRHPRPPSNALARLDHFTVRDATKGRDGHGLLAFRCFPGGEEELWVAEIEEYVRVFALRTADHVLVFESQEGALAGVSAFDRQDISVSGRLRVAGWRLEVIALAVRWHGQVVDADIDGCAETMKASEYVLRATFRRMLELDPRRVIVIGRVHDDNPASMSACARVGLLRTRRESNEYWELLGEVDPAAQPS
jgi:hypothetical protein